MEQIEESLRVRHFDHLPTPIDFSSKIEAANVPAVFNGAVKNWKAFSKWNPFDGGLDYLQERVGSATVEAMRSTSAPIFYGDLRNHERVPIPFSVFINSCKFHLQNLGSAGSSNFEQEGCVVVPANSEDTCSTSLDTPDQYYLAQVSILNFESKEGCSLEVLGEDIQMPIFLEAKRLVSVNLWMNRARCRSSTHYDPHHNLLCVAAGCKQVIMWPPSACRFLCPMPIYGEASNHSAVDIENPDLSVHLRGRQSSEYPQMVVLHSGDALFIPEGWFHQVDSDDLTIATNFWWKSDMMLNMLEHMDAYYLRRIMNRLMAKEMTQILPRSSVDSLKDITNHHSNNETSRDMENHGDTNEAAEGNHGLDYHEQKGTAKGDSENRGLILQQLEPVSLHVLHELISLVHDTVKVSGQDPDESASSEDTLVNPDSKHKSAATGSTSLLEKDPVASILWVVQPAVLRKVLLAMVHHFPRTLEALVLHVLSPAAAEALTQKFDEVDQQATKEQQNEFYKLFYSVFDDQYAAMDKILKGKEAFAFQVFRAVSNQYLGVNVESPR